MKKLRWLSRAASIAALSLAGHFACSAPSERRDAVPLAAPSATESREGGGTVTLRFVNPTQYDLWVDVTYGVPLSISTRTGILARPGFCMSDCGASCECRVCGEPLSTIRRIGAGEAFDVEWSGDHYVTEKCGDCSCNAKKAAEPGQYEVALRATAGRAPAGARPIGDDDPNVYAGAIGPGGADCRASGRITLGAMASTYEVKFQCQP